MAHISIGKGIYKQYRSLLMIYGIWSRDLSKIIFNSMTSLSIVSRAQKQ